VVFFLPLYCPVCGFFSPLVMMLARVACLLARLLFCVCDGAAAGYSVVVSGALLVSGLVEVVREGGGVRDEP